MTTLPTYLQPTSRCLFTELADGTAVLLHLDTKFYYTLNPTGVAVWKQLAGARTPVDGIVEHIVAEFEVEADAARADVLQMLANLLDEGLIEQASP